MCLWWFAILFLDVPKQRLHGGGCDSHDWFLNMSTWCFATCNLHDLLYKTYAFMILIYIDAYGTIAGNTSAGKTTWIPETPADGWAPADRNVLEKAWDKGIPVWIASLVLSCFDKSIERNGMHCGLLYVIMAVLTISCRFCSWFIRIKWEKCKVHIATTDLAHPCRSATRMCVKP